MLQSKKDGQIHYHTLGTTDLVSRVVGIFRPSLLELNMVGVDDGATPHII
jgi:hypothetical protein